MREELEDKIYYGSRKVRERLLGPLVWVFNLLRFKPDWVSYLGAVLMIFFIFLVKDDLILSLYFLIAALIMDLADGSLARLLGIDSDRGKFTDVLIDNLIFTLFVVGLTWSRLVSGPIAAVYVYFMLLVKVLMVFRRNITKNNKGDWFINPKVGALPNVIAYLSYILFAGYVVFGVNYLNPLFLFFSALLILKGFQDYRFIKNMVLNR